jgi:hypothetical protein
MRRQRGSQPDAHQLSGSRDSLISLLFRLVPDISVGSGTLSKGFKVTCHRPALEMMHIIFRSTSRDGWLSKVAVEYVKLATVVDRHNFWDVVAQGSSIEGVIRYKRSTG